MAKLTFWGATGTVTGSRYGLEIGRKKLLIDCGMFQGPKEDRLRNWDKFPVPPSEIDAVLLTHAHIDHVGYLPRFCNDGFRGVIHCTTATHELTEILIKDSAHLQEEDAYWANKQGYTKHSPAQPLYTIRDAEQVARYFRPVFYGEDIAIEAGARVKFRDAGHILGSSFIDIKTTVGGRPRKILFSGDLGRPEIPLLSDPVQVYNVDYLVMESTYGNRRHEGRSPSDDVARVINESVKRVGLLIIPSFAIGRKQTLLYVIRELEEAGKIPVLPVYVDSPMAVEATTVFERRIADLDLVSRTLTVQGKKIMHPRRLHLCQTRGESKETNDLKGGAIIISASGMATGGRILHHLERCLPNPAHTILLVGYQAEGTRGRIIQDRGPSVKIHGVEVPIRAAVENISGFSGHADYTEALAWLMGFNKPPEKTFIVHGEPEASQAMAARIREYLRWDVVVPKLDDSFEINL